MNSGHNLYKFPLYICKLLNRSLSISNIYTTTKQKMRKRKIDSCFKERLCVFCLIEGELPQSDANENRQCG